MIVLRNKEFSFFGLFGKKTMNPEEKLRRLNEYIDRGVKKKDSLSLSNLTSKSHEIERKLDIKFNKDWYKFLDIIVRFYSKNIPVWYNVLKSAKLDNVNDFTGGGNIILADDFFDIFPLPFPVMPYNDDEDEDICLITIGNDDCISYIPKNNSYEIFYKRRLRKLSDALKQYDIKEQLKFHHDNFSFYKENPDIYKIHLGIAEEYNKCIKII